MSYMTSTFKLFLQRFAVYCDAYKYFCKSKFELENVDLKRACFFRS